MSRIFVFDTNVLINAVLSTRSASATAVRKALREGILVYSDKTLAELHEKMYLPRFDKYVTLKQRLKFYYDYEMNAFPIIIRHSIKACRDPKDDKFLELAKKVLLPIALSQKMKTCWFCIRLKVFLF